MARRLGILLLVALPALGAISPDAVRAHIGFLASDLLEGRETGSRGFDIAAEYVAAQLEAAGVRPAGENGTYFQSVTMRSAVVDAAHSSMSVDGTPLTDRVDVLFRPDFVRTSSDAEGEIVFAGFGVVAPQLHHDDYAGIDVNGKLVLILSGAPPRFPADQRAFYSDRERKAALAASRGAIGVLSVATRIDEQRMPFAKMAQQSGMRSMRLLEGDVVADVHPEIRASVTISPAMAAKLFRLAPMTFEQVLDGAEKSVTQSFPLRQRAAIHTATELSTTASRNVIGRIAGATLPSEHVVLSAHLDHLGLASSGEDRVHNGALDNASGVAALIEIARTIAAGPQPNRSVVFVALTAEEKGGAGAEAFVSHPTVTSIVADVNMDMFTMLFPVADVVALGAEHSTLAALAQDAAASAGFLVSPDPQPEEVRFIRSDQYAFVKRGIPAMIFKPGVKSSDPAIDGATITRQWLRNVYHTVGDNPGQKLDYRSGARWAEANLKLVLAVANAKSRPEWNRGDFFGDTFGKK